MKITSITVENLFGFLTHKIPLNNEDGITLIHGTNGCGKTTLLTLIHAVFTGDFATLSTLIFDRIIIKYNNNIELTVKKSWSDSSFKMDFSEIEEINPPATKISFSRSDLAEEYTVDSSHFLKRTKLWQLFDTEIPALSQIEPDATDDEWLSVKQVMRKYGLMLSEQIQKPKWLFELLDNIKVHFVKTGRLTQLTSTGQHARDAVEIYSNEICEIIAKKLATYFAMSQDRTFLEALFNKNFPENVSENELRQRYFETEKRLRKLMAVGLLDEKTNIALPNTELLSLESLEKKVLWLYLEEVNEKLKSVSDIQKRIETFMDIIAPKLRNKKFRIDRNKGFIFEKTNGNPGKLEPAALSSGEQHQLVLFYELIFKSEANSLFLIDEPEISLHIEWQRQFLKDIAKITPLGDYTFIIVTHSPQIIHNRRDLAVALEGGILSEQS
jgi:predicted ATP-binding protein involved in virulence